MRRGGEACPARGLRNKSDGRGTREAAAPARTGRAAHFIAVDAKGHRASRTSTASIGATTSIARGRKNVFNALVGIDDQIQPGLKRKKYVLVKVNGLAPGRNIGSTNLDCVHGILDYLAPRFKGPVVITEGGEATYKQAFEEFGWNTVAPEHKPMDIGFALLNDNQR